MLALIFILTVLTVALFALTLMQVRTGRAAVAAQLEQMQGGGDPNETLARRRRQVRSERLKSVLQVLGQRVEGGRTDTTAVRRFMVQAGYSDPSAVSVYWASRVALALGLPSAGMVILPLLGAGSTQVLLGLVWLGTIGWIGPTFFVRGRLKARQKELQLALPDMLDMLVVCVEAGLGLNQALVRVSDEIDHVSTVMSEQLAMVNLEMRAGKPRAEALRNLAARTAVDDVRSLVASLIQTDRFGTSIVQALRMYSDSLRTERRRRAEEQAAKAGVKMIIPIVVFALLPLLMVTLGPAMIELYHNLAPTVRK